MGREEGRWAYPCRDGNEYLLQLKLLGILHPE